MTKRYARIKNDVFVGFYKCTHPDFEFESGEFIEITENDIDNLLNQQSSSNEIRVLKNKTLGIYKKPLCNSNIIKPVFNYIEEKWEENATLLEQEEFYRNKIINKTKEILEIETSGFGSGNSKKELEEFKLKHKEISHQLGLEEDMQLK